MRIGSDRNTPSHRVVRGRTLLRGVADDVPLEEMPPRASAIDAKLTRRDVQIGALLGCVEMIRSGTTSFHDLFYWEDEVARAVRESGMRGFLSWVTLDEAFTTQHGSPLKNAGAFVVKQKDDPLATPSSGGQGGDDPVPEMLEAGVVVGLGTDSPISNNGMDVFADMKIAALLHKSTRWDARIMPAQSVLDLATIHAARALHVEREIGSIEVGKRADLAVVSLKGAHTTPFYPESVIRHLVYSGRGSDVQATVVDGKVLMAAGGVRTVDGAGVIARAQETARELFEA